MSNVWNTAKVEKIILDFKKFGVIPDKHPFFNRRPNVRKGGIVFGYTQDELVELIKCEDDIIYFANNYVKILTGEGGRRLLKDAGGLRPYQEKMLKQFQENKYSIVLASRQIGKSITVAIFVAWYILFNKDANILLLSETGWKAKDLLKKIANIQDSLPFYMQSGLEYSSTQRRIYDGGCTLVSENTTENSGVSGSYEFVYWDEMALLDASMQEKIFTGVFPTMASFGKKARFIITSTPRGRNNKFHDIWVGATAEKSSPKYIPFAYSKIYWYDVEGRDEAWKKNEVAIMGEDGFAREYDLSFDVDEDILANDEVKRILNSKFAVYEYIKETSLKGKLKLHPLYNIEDLSDVNRRFHISIDLASGKADGDYTVFNIFEVFLKSRDEIKQIEFFETEADLFKQKQIGILRSNKYQLEQMAKMLYRLVDEIFDAENVRLSVEMNHRGDFFLEKVFTYLGNKNALKGLREQLVVAYPPHLDFEKEESCWEEGITHTPKSKKTVVENFNMSVESFDVELSESVTIEEGLSFGKDKKGNYKGLGGNDDCFMSALNVQPFRKTTEFAEFVDELYSMLTYEDKKYVEGVLEIDGGYEVDDDIY